MKKKRNKVSRSKRPWLKWILVAGVATFAYFVWYSLTPLDFKPVPRQFVIRRGGLMSVAAQLKEQGILTDTWRFRIMAQALGGAGKLRSGNYLIQDTVCPLELYTIMTGREPLEGEMQIKPGLTFKQVRAALGAAMLLEHDSNGMTDADLMAKLREPGQYPEGLFFPDAYFYPKGDTDLEVLHRARDEMRKRLMQAWQNRAPGLPYQTPYQALIMASIIERETARPSERPLVARVFINRLQTGMRLQTDPTVIYGMGDSYTGDIHKSDLLRDTPYNTYTRPGLPPTPIAMPSMESIQAALHPAVSKALYFVARGDGTHQFSDTLEEHNAAVAKYQLHRQ